MATIKCFEEIKAWQKARALNEKVGSYIDNGRFKRNFRLIDQIEGSAGSIMDNIAEGFERSGNREFLRFLYFSKGSCGEFRSQFYRALDRKYIQQNEFDEFFELSKEVIVMLQKLIGYLEHSELKETKYKSRNSLTRELVNS